MTKEEIDILWNKAMRLSIEDGDQYTRYRFAELVAEAERNSWPAEMEAMERQVNILTDALAQAKAEEREACAKVCDDKAMYCEEKAQEAIEAGEHDEVNAIRSTAWQISVCAAAIRARSNT